MDLLSNRSMWVEHYLPQWTTPDRSAARLAWSEAGVELRIEADQLPWRDEDGPMRVSNLQTATFSGAAGSQVGTHRHRGAGLMVRSPQELRRLWLTSSGTIRVRVSASDDPTCMVGLWLVGLEQTSPEDSGEICVAELFGHQIGHDSTVVRTGIKAHHDPRLVDEVRDLKVAIDARQPHWYWAQWDDDGVRFGVDDQTTMVSRQRLSYELQLMLDLFEFPEADQPRQPADYPKTAQIHAVEYQPSPM